jgi:hypothetical protein
MLPILILAGVAGWAWHKRRHPGTLSPAAARVHGALMGQEFNPAKLEQAAFHFKAKGMAPQAADLKGKAAQIRKQARVAAMLCEGARAGDQNAMGMIAAIRDQAEKNNPRAIVSANLIAAYCAARPALQLGPLGETPMLDNGRSGLPRAEL